MELSFIEAQSAKILTFFVMLWSMAFGQLCVMEIVLNKFSNP